MALTPIELNKRVSDLKIEKIAVEQAIKNLKGVEIVGNLYIPKNPVKPSIKKNIVIAGITSLFVGIFLAFLMEYIDRIKLQSKND